MSGISYPLQANKITRFEKQTNVSVNVFGYKDEVYQFRISEHKGRMYYVNLTLFCNINGYKQYYLILDRSLLLLGLTKRGHTKLYFNYCFHTFSDINNMNTARQRLEVHQILCLKYGAQTIILMRKPKIWCLEITLCHKVPYAVYADFESFLVPIAHCSRDSNTSH